MKKAIRYLRFSQIGQSNSSIERQELYTDQWLKYNDVELVDTFIDRGRSAKTFERPDFIKLKDFIDKHYRNVDYLLVDQMDRFSRDAGEAMTLTKLLQRKYNIQIVSVSEGITFDYDTPGSFFRAGLQLLLAEEDNINRSIKVKGGVYTAKAKEGRYIYKTAPFGYAKVGQRKDKHLVIIEEEAEIIRFIHDSFLKGVPYYIIERQARDLGFTVKGNDAIKRVLTSPVYAGLLNVKPYKDYPGGIFEGIHEPIIELANWNLVQQKIKKKIKTRVLIDDQLPLRAILKCHCGLPLTGAPSRNSRGNYYYYYKCKISGHNNISAIKAHEQFLSACKYLSLPNSIITRIKTASKSSLDKQLSDVHKNQKKLNDELVKAEENLMQVEEKFITNQISKDTYDRMYSKYIDELLIYKGKIRKSNKPTNVIASLLEKNIELLKNLPKIFQQADTLQKQEFIKIVFDNNLYYKNGTYRTPTMLKALSHNHLIMKEKGVLCYEKKEGLRNEDPLSALKGSRTPNLLIRSQVLYPVKLWAQLFWLP